MKRFVLLFSLLFIASQATIPHKVVLCGVCKDVATRVPASIQIMEKIGSLFADYRVIVYENNSSDATPHILKKWSSRNTKVLAITEQVPNVILNKEIVNRLKTGEYFRPELIARARNIVLDKAMSSEYEDCDYVIWMDMDFILEPEYEGIQELFKVNQPWDAVFAYGVAPDNNHWDWYALRDEVCPYGPEILGHFWFQPKKLALQKNDLWYPVYSAFGGFGIYRKEAIRGCRYSALVTRDLGTCVQQILKNHHQHTLTKRYLADVQKLHVVKISTATQLHPIVSEQYGIVVEDTHDEIVWRMNSFTYLFPVVCEHVPFHASMIVNGYDKLYINPRLKFYYGDRYPKTKERK